MASERPFESTHWETVTEEKTDHGRVVVRTGVETRQFPQVYIDRSRAAAQAFNRWCIRVATALIVLLVIGALIVAFVASIALSIVIVLIAGALGGTVAWWYRRPAKPNVRMVYFRRYGPFQTLVMPGDEDSARMNYLLEVAGQKFGIEKDLYGVVSKITYGEVYHTSHYRLLEVRDREGKVLYHDVGQTGWREEEHPAPATMPADPL